MTEHHTPVAILCVDDEANVLKALRRLFMDEPFTILTAESGPEGLEKLAAEPQVQVVVSDYRMPGMNGVDFLKEVFDRRPDTVRIVLSGYADTAAIVAAINEGKIYKFIPKPWNDDELRITIAKAVELYFLQQENITLSKELQDANEELKTINQNLENMVTERTQEIFFQNQALATGHFILDSLPVGVIGVGLDHVLVQFNKHAAELLADQGGLHMDREAAGCLPPPLLQMLEELHSPGDTRQDDIALGRRSIRLTGTYMQNKKGQAGKILVLTDARKTS